MNILGETIQHTTYGEGVISDLSGPYLIVEFHDTRKKFRYPEAFRSHLILKNKQAQRFVDLKINELGPYTLPVRKCAFGEPDSV